MKYTSDDVVYEKGRAEDLEQIVKLGLQVIKLNGLGDVVAVNFEKGASHLANVLVSDTVLVARLKGTIVGVLVLEEGDIWWSDQRFFTNTLFYVHPKYRKLGIQNKLLYFAKAMTDETGLPFVFDFFSFDPKSGIIEEWMTLNGFKRLGFKAAYLKG